MGGRSRVQGKSSLALSVTIDPIFLEGDGTPTMSQNGNSRIPPACTVRMTRESGWGIGVENVR